jgi:hypothetical protein
MDWRSRYTGSSLRKAVAGFLLCVIILKGLALVGLTTHFAGSSDPSGPVIESLVLDGHCQKLGTDGKPGPRAGHHADCCILCAHDYKDRAVVLRSTLLVIDVLRPRDTRQDGTFDVVSDDGPPRLQWFGTAWYPTAPPKA